LYLALDSDLEILPIVNKIDLPSARTQEVSQEVAALLGVAEDSVIRISAKLGQNIDRVLEEIVAQVPAPSGAAEGPLRALIFDSHYDSYKGVIAYVRIREGLLEVGQPCLAMATGARFDPIEVGYFGPEMRPTGSLFAGEVGYVATGLKTVRECRVGDTLTSGSRPAEERLPGYRQLKPMVFAGIYPVEGEDYAALKDSLEKLQLNDASLIFEPETSQALNYGFRCGFLGLFHMDIIQERLEREYGLEVVATAPSVQYEILTQDGRIQHISSPVDLPEESEIEEIREPWMQLQIFTPEAYYGTVMDLGNRHRAIFRAQDYPSPGRIQMTFEIPLAELIVDFYDQLKSRTRGYASLDYHFLEYRPEELVRLDVLINEEVVDALASIVHREEAYQRGQALVSKLKELIPRQLYAVPIQAAAGGKVISRANVKALRKDVLAKCYGGDITRKKKLLEKQKRGKRRMKKVGRVEIPQEAFMAVLRIHGE